MAETRYQMAALPDELLNYFMLHEGRVKWAAEPPTIKHVNFRSRRAPWGAEAGGRAIHGRGKLITFAKCALLTSDIRYALERGEWPWQVAGAVTYEPGAQDADALAVVRQRWRLDSGNLVWRVSRGFTRTGEAQYPEGSTVIGFAMSGYRDRLVSTGGFGFIRSDVVHALEHGAFPWDEWN